MKFKEFGVEIWRNAHENQCRCHLAGVAARPDDSRHAFSRSVGLGLEDVQLVLAIHRNP